MAESNEPLGSSGVVYLVGAGPGDPRLITLRGVECLRRADVVVYDSLASAKLLEFAPAEAERVAVGRRHDRRCAPQSEINQLLVARARSGKTVVRLKGGDPFVFGRGGEEAAALREAQVRFEVVPGVTAGVAAAACAGIPVTHRALASSVTFVTGHEDPEKTGATIDWKVLAQIPGTLVFYMSVSRLAHVTASLLAHGMPASTPAAAIHRGTTAEQRTVIGSLDDIADRVREAGLTPPAIIVVGSVAALGSSLRWFEDRLLFGQRVLVTRPAHQSAGLVDHLTELGAEVLELPALEVEPPIDRQAVDRAIADLHRFGTLVFTSANGVTCFFERLLSIGHDVRKLGSAQIAAIGAATARELQQYHLRADLVPDEANSEALVESLREMDGVRPMLLIRGESAREALPQGLRDAGIAFEEVAVYRTVEPDWDASVVERLARGEIDWVTVTSPRTVQSLVRRLPADARGHLGMRTKLASISRLTSAAARELGVEVAVEAKTAGMESLVDAIVAWQRQSR